MDRDSIVLPVPAISHHKLLGILCALPISVLVEDKEFMVVHLFVFFPLVLWLIARKGALLTELTAIDKLAAAYFGWALISLTVGTVSAVWQGGDEFLGPRLASTLATMLYWVIPFLLGRIIFRSDIEIKCFLDGIIIGALATALALLANYSYVWSTDPAQVRYAIGQRVVLGICFLSVMYLFAADLKARAFLGILLMLLVVGLSETRAAFAQLIVGLLVSLWFWRSFVVKHVMGMAVLAVIATAVALSVGQTAWRLEWLSDTSISYGEGLVQTEDISTLMRFAIWEELLSKLFQSPITTIFGFGQLGPSYVGGTIALGSIYYVAENYSAHSEYVDQLVRGGTVALVIITALYASVVISSFRVFRKSALLGPAFRGIAIGLIGAAVYATNHESLRYSWFGIMFWILVGALSNFNGRFQRRTRQRGVPRVDAAQRLTA